MGQAIIAPLPNAEVYSDANTWTAEAKARGFIIAQVTAVAQPTGSVVAQTPGGLCMGMWFAESQRGWMARA